MRTIYEDECLSACVSHDDSHWDFTMKNRKNPRFQCTCRKRGNTFDILFIRSLYPLKTCLL